MQHDGGDLLLTNASETGSGDGWKERVSLSMRVVNAHYQMRCSRRIDLQQLAKVVDGKLYRGRPTMLSCRMMGKRIQFFPNGTIQILGGGVTKSLLTTMTQMVSHLLSQCISMADFSLSPWTVNNIVFYFNLFQLFSVDHIMCSKDVSYEPELFPAILICKWQPAHITLFPNGRGMITGIKLPKQALDIVYCIPSFLQQHADLHRQ